MANKQIYQYAVGTLDLTKAFPIQPTGGGTVQKTTIQDFITFLQTNGITGGCLMFPTIALLKATTILVDKGLLYVTIGDPNIFEDGAKYYYDASSNADDNGRSVLKPNSIISGPGRFIQFTA